MDSNLALLQALLPALETETLQLSLQADLSGLQLAPIASRKGLETLPPTRQTSAFLRDSRNNKTS